MIIFHIGLFENSQNIMNQTLFQETAKLKRPVPPEKVIELSDKLLVLDNANIKMLDSPFKVYSEPNSLKTAQLFGEVNHLE